MNGYSRLASLIAAHDELAIVRSYKSAYALDLLYHQADLLHLLQDWAAEVGEDQNADDGDRRSYEYYFQKLARPEVGKHHSAQWLKWLEVRQKLKEYRSAIQAFRDVSRERQPSASEIDTLRVWLQRAGAGNDFLRGSESDTWGEAADDDLISLMKPADKDALSRLAFGPISAWIHDHITDRFTKEIELKDPFLTEKPIPTPLKKYSNNVIEGFVSAITTILASLFPTMSIFALYYVQDQVARLGMIVAFCTLFSAVLVLVTDARRIDCFAATAAFAAVQVVFVGTTTT